jgi:putative transposase
MPEYRCPNEAGGPCVLTVSAHHGRKVLVQDELRQAFRQGAEWAGQTLPFTNNVWMPLPGHLRCLWTLPPRDNDSWAGWLVITRHASHRRGRPT